MNLKKVALSLLLGGSMFAVGCGDDDSGPSSGTLPPEDVPTCTLNGEAGMRDFQINGLRIPVSGGGGSPITPLNNIGFNVDGLVTSTVNDVAGCRKADGVPGGIDNALSEIIGGLSDLLAMASVDINAELQGAVDDNAIDLNVRLGDWNMTATDPCVSITISGMSGGQTLTPITGNAALNANVISAIAFPTALTIVPAFQLNPDGGLGGTCTMNCVTVNLPITIQGLRGRIVFDATQSAIVVADQATLEGPTGNSSSTVIGGYVRYAGTDAAAFSVGLMGLTNQIGIDFDTVNGIFTQFLDLDSTPGPGLSACTSTGGSNVSADTFSAGILARGVVQAP